MSVMQIDSYSVEVIGFSEAEKLLLASAFGLFSRRTPRFFQQEPGVKLPNVFLIDANDPVAVDRFRTRDISGSTPTIFIGDSSCGTDWPVLVRPIRWLKLLQALELSMALPTAAAPLKAVVDFDVTNPTLGTPAVTKSSPAPGTGSTTGAQAAAPRIETFATKTAKQKIPEPSTGQPVKPQADSVLVVDDNSTVREFMKNKLAAFNFNVDYAESGEQAIGLTGQKYYAIIFLDVIMPGIDGYQVCKLIKSKRASPKTTVIMLTSKDSPFDKIRGSMSGCDAYLTKPVDEEKLLETIVKFLPIRT